MVKALATIEAHRLSICC